MADVDHGKMDGFVAQAEAIVAGCVPRVGTMPPQNPSCDPNRAPDVIGYHDDREIPNYWTYAHDFVLQDHMFEPAISWSYVAHLFLMSEWSATCAKYGEASSCQNDLSNFNLQTSQLGGDYPGEAQLSFPYYHLDWTDLTYLLYRHHVSWRYYLSNGFQPDCDDDAAECPPVPQGVHVPGIWNPLLWFDTVHQDGQVGNIQDASHLFTDAASGALPAVSWVVPNSTVSEHPSSSITTGQAYVTNIINAIMKNRLGLDGDLSGLGRLGRLLRQRAAAPSGRERLRAARPRPWSSAPTPSRATSTTRRSALTPTPSSSKTIS